MTHRNCQKRDTLRISLTYFRDIDLLQKKNHRQKHNIHIFSFLPFRPFLSRSLPHLILYFIFHEWTLTVFWIIEFRALLAMNNQSVRHNSSAIYSFTYRLNGSTLTAAAHGDRPRLVSTTYFFFRQPRFPVNKHFRANSLRWNSSERRLLLYYYIKSIILHIRSSITFAYKIIFFIVNALPHFSPSRAQTFFFHEWIDCLSESSVS